MDVTEDDHAKSNKPVSQRTVCIFSLICGIRIGGRHVKGN
jgi:hypothetical protein